MVKILAVTALGGVLGFVSLVGGPLGLLPSVVVAAASFVASSGRQRTQLSGLLLATAGITASLLLGRVILSIANDPAVSLGPGTVETFAGALIVGLIGIGTALAGTLHYRADEN